MKFFQILFVVFFCSVSAQRNLPFDSLKLNDTKDLYADDYGNIYVYKSKDFSFTKLDSLGKQIGKLMLTLPFKVQSVQNLLNIPSFSENAQEVKYFDQNLAEIQTVNFRQKFGFVKRVFAEDLQQIWVLDESTKRLIQYKFREDQILNSYPYDMDFEKILDFIVFENKFFVLSSEDFKVYDFKANILFRSSISQGRRLRRENGKIFIIGKNTIHKFENAELSLIFKDEDLEIVDKNSNSYYGIKANKLYIYQP